MGCFCRSARCAIGAARRVLGVDDHELERRLAEDPDLPYRNKAEAGIEYEGEATLHVTLREGTHDNE